MNAWCCSRCNTFTTDGDVDDLPDGWVQRSLPTRGSKGARSSNVRVLCVACDDHLYAWLTA